jgi:NAD(P)-dependent dehydrogenase (short-subunit alcohol dehydrogenase family)
MKDFGGRVALVTGAGSGIGQATALALAAEGVSVAVTDIDLEAAQATVQLISEQGMSARAFELDVSDRESIDQAALAIEEALGTPSILINNAGIAVGGFFLDSSPESWQRVMSINLMGVVNCCHRFIPAIVQEGKGGYVVNMASMLGYIGARGVSAYCTTKFGVLGFSESLRAELKDHNIGVSAICPGVVRTNIISAGVLESATVDVEAKRIEIEAVYEKRDYSPVLVAIAILKAIRNNRALVPVTTEAWGAYYAKRWAPWLVRWMSRNDLA